MSVDVGLWPSRSPDINENLLKSYVTAVRDVVHGLLERVEPHYCITLKNMFAKKEGLLIMRCKYVCFGTVCSDGTVLPDPCPFVF